MIHHVYGDYGYITEKLLFSGTKEEALAFAKKEDWANNYEFGSVDVARHAVDGDYIDIWTWRREDDAS